MLKPTYWLYRLSKNINIKKIFFIYSAIVVIFTLIKPFIFMNMATISQKLCLIPAGIWSILGPFLIVQFYNKYEDIICKLMRNEVGHKSTIIKNSLIDNKKINIAVSIIWISILLCVLLIFPQSLEFLYIYGYSDISYWIFIIIAIYLLQLTATGFSGVISCLLLIYRLNKNVDNNESYLYKLIEKEKDVADELIEFCFLASFYFSTGVLFIPTLMIYMNNANSFIVCIIILSAIILYSVFIFLSYIVPMFIIENTIKKYKKIKLMILNGNMIWQHQITNILK